MHYFLLYLTMILCAIAVNKKGAVLRRPHILNCDEMKIHSGLLFLTLLSLSLISLVSSGHAWSNRLDESGDFHLVGGDDDLEDFDVDEATDIKQDGNIVMVEVEKSPSEEYKPKALSFRQVDEVLLIKKLARHGH